MHIILSNSSNQPIYEQIALQIKDQIINGGLTEAELLPSIRSLAKELKISVITTKRAYEELERDGFITTIPGKGSYVAAQNWAYLKESRIRIVEEKFLEGIAAAKVIDLTLDELVSMLEILFREGS